jgi:glycosyltransferase involved in cell wall biosynthesis
MLTLRSAEPRRILHVVGDSRFGGAGRIILRLGEVAKAEGWEVDILTTDGIFQREVRQHGLGLVNLDVIRRPIRPLWDLAGLVRLCGFLRRERYAIVHTHTSKAGFVGRLAARLAGIPAIIHTVHGFAFHEASPFSVRLLYTALERTASRWCDRIVSVSEFHRLWALELRICDTSKIVAIPNGIAALPKPELAPGVLRRVLGIREQEFLILSMSRLARDKGLEHLIDAAAILTRYETCFKVVIAGDGPIRAQLEERVRDLGVADRVVFVGFREDIADLLAASDLIVLPSLREGLSIALLEAMAAGRAIVATSIGSHRELASQAKIAWLVPPSDPNALCASILEAGRNPEQMLRYGTNARALFESHYTEDRMLSSYQQLYSELLEQKCSAKTDGGAPPTQIRCGKGSGNASKHDGPQIVYQFRQPKGGRS